MAKPIYCGFRGNQRWPVDEVGLLPAHGPVETLMRAQRALPSLTEGWIFAFPAVDQGVFLTAKATG